MKRIICILVWVGLLIALPVLAQTSTLGLTAEDFDLLTTANAAPVNTFGFEFTSYLTVENLDTFAIQANLSGAGAVDREAHFFSATVNGDLTLGSSQHSTVDTEIRLIDDRIYLNPGDGWQAREGAYEWASELIYQIFTLDADSSSLAEWNLSGVTGFDDVMAAVQAIDPAAFLGIERLADETVGDAQTAHFQITIDPYALMQTDTFVDAVATLANAQGTPLVILERDELKDIVVANSALFEGAELAVDQYIGLDDMRIHRLALNLKLPADPSKLDFTETTFVVNAAFDLTLGGHDQPVTIELPEDAETVEAFTFPEPPALELPGDGLTEYVFFETVGEGETFSQPFEAQAGDSVSVTVRGVGLDYDANATLLSPGGEVLAENDDYETAVFGLSGFDPYIPDTTISESGIYTLEVKEYEGAAGSFVLTITVKR